MSQHWPFVRKLLKNKIFTWPPFVYNIGISGRFGKETMVPLIPRTTRDVQIWLKHIFLSSILVPRWCASPFALDFSENILTYYFYCCLQRATVSLNQLKRCFKVVWCQDQLHQTTPCHSCEFRSLERLVSTKCGLLTGHVVFGKIWGTNLLEPIEIENRSCDHLLACCWFRGRDRQYHPQVRVHAS